MRGWPRSVALGEVAWHVALGAASGFVLAWLAARRDDNPVRMRARV